MSTDTTPNTGGGQDYLDKVRKLLAIAEHPNTTEEYRAVVMGKVAALTAQFGLAEALAQAQADADAGIHTPPADRIIVIPSPYTSDKALLLAWIAEELGCKAILKWPHKRSADRRWQVHMFGYGSDLDRAELLYTSLLVQAAHGMTPDHIPSWENPKAWRRAFLLGFRKQIRLRLRAAEARARDDHDQAHEGTSSALVLVDRADRIAHRVAEVYPDLKTYRPSYTSSDGHRNGEERGRRADLGDTRVGNGAHHRNRAIGA